jgi:hypothetical protein
MADAKCKRRPVSVRSQRLTRQVWCVREAARLALRYAQPAANRQRLHRQFPAADVVLVTHAGKLLRSTDGHSDRRRYSPKIPLNA